MLYQTVVRVMQALLITHLHKCLTQKKILRGDGDVLQDILLSTVSGKNKPLVESNA